MNSFNFDLLQRELVELNRIRTCRDIWKRLMLEHRITRYKEGERLAAETYWHYAREYDKKLKEGEHK